MFCTNCGVELRETDRFCAQCGNPAAGGPAPAPRYGQRRLTLVQEGKKIAGVCTGFACYFNMDVILMRIIWLVAAFMTGIGFHAYPIAWLLMPKEETVARHSTEVVHQAS